MKFIMKNIAFVFLVITAGAAVLQPAWAGKPRDPGEYFFEQTLGDLVSDLEEAKKQGKKGILLFFEQEECPFCHRMKNTVLNQPEVQDYFRKRFLIFAMDIKSASEVTAFDGRATTMKDYFNFLTNNRNATPVFAFFDLNGKMVVRYTGATSGVQEFMWLGQYASEAIYEKMPFSRYKRMMRKQAER